MPRPLRATGTRTPQLLSKPKSQGGRWGRRGGQVPCVPPRVPEDYGREPMAQIPVGSVEEVGKSAGPHLAGAEATGHWKIERARARQGAPGCAGAGVGREAAVLLLRGAPPARAPRRRDPAPAGCVAPERLPNPSVRPHAPESCFEYYFAVDVFKVVFPSSAPNNSPRLLVTKARFGIPLPSSPGSGPRSWGRPAPALYPQSLFQRLLKQPLGGALLQCAPRPPFTPTRMEGCEC